MSDQLIKIRQFEQGSAFAQWLQQDDPAVHNYVMHYYDIEVESDSQVVFTLQGYVKDIYAPPKMTINGATYFEYNAVDRPYGSFMISDAGVLTWLDDDYTLKKGDTVVVECPVDEGGKEKLQVEIIDDALYLVINNNILVVEINGSIYPLCVEIGADSSVSFYVNKDLEKVYFTVNSDGTITEIN